MTYFVGILYSIVLLTTIWSGNTEYFNSQEESQISRSRFFSSPNYF